MELYQLQSFEAVARTGSLTKAAQERFIGQPALSAQIKALEAEFKLPLFVRTPRGMTLTAVGETLLPTARAAIEAAEHVTRTAQGLHRQTPHRLRLGLIDCGYDLRLAAWSSRMTHKVPRVSIQLKQGNSGSNLDALLDWRLDAAVVESPGLADDRLVTRKLGTSTLGVIAPIAWTDRVRHATWAELAELPWIFQDPSCSYYMLMLQQTQSQNITLQSQFRSDSFDTILDLVSAGLAVSIADLGRAQSRVEEGTLFIWPQFEYTMPVWAVALAQRQEEPAVAAFLESTVQAHSPRPVRRQARITQADTAPHHAAPRTTA